jgi:hypothetical protein
MAASYADLDRCAKLMGLVSSDAGDGANAARKLEEKMDACGISFNELYKFVEYDPNHSFVYARFAELKAKCEAIWKQDHVVSHESDPNWTWIPEHERRTRGGKIAKVAGYWRHTARKKSPEPWRYDRNASPGDGYRWIDGHERHHAHKGQVKRVSVRGHWRTVQIAKVRKAA